MNVLCLAAGVLFYYCFFALLNIGHEPSIPKSVENYRDVLVEDSMYKATVISKPPLKPTWIGTPALIQISTK